MEPGLHNRTGAELPPLTQKQYIGGGALIGMMGGFVSLNIYQSNHSQDSYDADVTAQQHDINVLEKPMADPMTAPDIIRGNQTKIDQHRSTIKHINTTRPGETNHAVEAGLFFSPIALGAFAGYAIKAGLNKRRARRLAAKTQR